MAHLQVLGEGLSAGKQRAFEDARKMQASVAADCNKSGKPIPPYRLTELIGKGSFGRVYRATDLKNKQLVAVKIINVDESDTVNPKLADTYSDLLKEINALQRLSEIKAQNINHVIEALPVGHAMWMVTEYCAGGSVATLMKPTAPGGLQEKWIIPILREVTVAIHWVHKEGIIHRDIKCANVLVTEVGSVQLCDFGVAGMMESKFDKRSTVIGTPHWMAPELFDQNAQYGTEVDIWAFGSMVFELASGLPPNARAGVGLPHLGDFLREHIPRLEGDQYSTQLKDLVAFCLVENPSQRPTIEQIQKHPYIYNTSAQYPTRTLANLVKAYKLWEDRGGSRKSLFGPGGAQAPADLDLDSTSLAADEWNFSTTLAFDKSLHDDTDTMSEAQAVRDVYGSAVDFPSHNFGGDTARPHPKGGNKGRRRPPPQALAAVKAPLEKVFDPNTISNYDENSRMYYNRGPMPPLPPPNAPGQPPARAASASHLPLRDDSLHSTLRESLIDLDASLGGGDLATFTDVGTIKAGGPSQQQRPMPRPGPRMSMDNNWSFAGATTESASSQQYHYDSAPMTPAGDLNHERPEIEWQWPTTIPPAPSSNPDHFGPSSYDDMPPLDTPGRPRLMHHPTDPVGLPSQGYDPPRTATSLSATNAASTANDRMSMASLIDLDMSMPEPVTSTMAPPAPYEHLTRPSTANSDAASITGSESGGGGNPFELERHASVYAPLSMTTREPSIYVSEDMDLPSAFARQQPPQHQQQPSYPQQTSHQQASPQQQHQYHYSHQPREPSLYYQSPHQLHEPQQAEYVNEDEDEYDEQRSTDGGGGGGSGEEEDVVDEQFVPRPGPGPGPGHGHAHGASAPTSSSTGQLPPRSMPMPLPPPVAPPSAAVMEGRATPGDVTNEMRRLIGALGEHLSLIGNQVAEMEPRRAR